MAESKDRAAEKAAEKAEAAVEAADQADLEAKKAAAEEAGTKACPECRGELLKHGNANPHKAGAWHCNDCGRCWAPGLRELR